MLYDQQGADLARLSDDDLLTYTHSRGLYLATFFIGAVLEREGERTAAEQPASFDGKRRPAACGAVLF